MIMQVIKTDEIQHPVLYEDEVITIYGELKSFGLLLHAHVHKWTLSAAKHVFEVIMDVVAFSPEPVFAFAYNKKLKKFCEMHGFVSIDTVYNTEDKVIGELMTVPQSGDKYV